MLNLEADEVAQLLADNRIAELADLDSTLVADLLKDLREEGIDIELGGFTDVQFTDLAERLAAAAGGDVDAEWRNHGVDPVDAEPK